VAGDERRLALDKSACREIEANKTGALLPANEVLSHSHRHILLGVMEAGKYETWRNSMIAIILDLFIELQMSAIMITVSLLIIEHVDSGRGFTRDLMFIKVKQQGGLF